MELNLVIALPGRTPYPLTHRRLVRFSEWGGLRVVGRLLVAVASKTRRSCAAGASPATVLAVSGERLDPRGVRTAQVELDVRPANESRFRTTCALELPGGRVPRAGAAVQVKFDPHAHRHLVLV